MRILGVGLGGEFWRVLSVGFGENVNLCGLSLLVAKKILAKISIQNPPCQLICFVPCILLCSFARFWAFLTLLGFRFAFELFCGDFVAI